MQISPNGVYGSEPYVGIGNTVLESFNDSFHNALTLRRSDANHGILIYRQIAGKNAVAADADASQAKLIAVLGQKELGSVTDDINWIDYGVYEQPFWTAKGTVNEFLGSDTSTVETEQIHFPTIVGVGTTTHR